MKAKLFLVLVFALALVVSGCTQATPPAPETPPPPAETEYAPEPPPEYEEVEDDHLIDYMPESNAFSSLDWAGVYRGVIPSAAGMGILVQLELDYTPDEGSFVLRAQYLVDERDVDEISASWDLEEWGDDVATFEGSLSWPEFGNRNVIELGGAQERSWPPFYHVGEGFLRQLDLSGGTITGELAESYILTKIG